MSRLWIAGAALLLAAGCQAAQATSTEEPPEGEVWLTQESTQTAQIVEMKPQLIPQAVRAAGKVAFNDLRVSHVLTPVTGRVTRVLAPPGQHVKQGAPLAIIASPEVGSAYSDMVKAQSDLDAADREFRRQQQLVAAHASPQRDLETAEDGFHKAKAEFDRARQKVLLLRSGSINKVTQEYTLRSPIEGDVIALMVNPGTEVQGLYSTGNAVELFTIGDTKEVWVYADVAESDIARVKVGSKVSIKVIAYPNQSFAGTVDQIAQTLDPVVRTIRVRCTLHNPGGELFPEMYASVAIEAPPVKALAIPASAVESISGQSFALIAAGHLPDGRMVCKRRAIRLGSAESAGLVEVLEGLSEGDRIVLEQTPAKKDADDEVWLTPQQLQAAGIRVITAEQQSVEDAVTLGGRLAFDDLQVTHVFPPVSGRVTQVLAAVGDRVQKGTPLLKLISPEVGSAFSDVVKARADLTAAEHELQRQKELFEAHAGAQRDLELAENNHQKSQAEFERAQQMKSLLHAGDIDGVSQEFTLRSPIAGQIVARSVFPGLEVQGQYAGQGVALELFTIGDTDELLVLGEVYEMDLPLVKDGAPVTLRMPAWPDKVFRGTAEWVADVLDPDHHTAKVRCRFANADHLLKPEMYEMVTVAVPAAHILAVPRAAILRQGAERILFVQTHQGQDGRLGFKRRVVQVNEEKPGGLVPIVGGLEPNEKVVVAGGIFLLGML